MGSKKNEKHLKSYDCDGEGLDFHGLDASLTGVWLWGWISFENL